MLAQDSLDIRLAYPASGKHQFEIVEFGAAYRSVQDANTAESIFSGFGAFFGNGNLSWTERSIASYRSWFGYHELQSPAGVTTREVFMDFSLSYGRRIFPQAQTYLAVGGQAGLLGPARWTPALQNTEVSWEIVGGIGPWMYAHGGLGPLLGGKPWRWYAEAHVPVVAYVNRPLYGLVLEQESSQDHQVGWIGDLLRLQAEVGIRFWRAKDPCRNKPHDRWKIAYRWDLLHWQPDEGQAVTTAMHQLQFGFMIGQDLSKKKKRTP